MRDKSGKKINLRQAFKKFMPFSHAALATGALVIALPEIGHSAEPDVDKSNAQDTMVVTASGFNQNLQDAPASITVLTREQLDKGKFTDLTDALRNVQGVAVTGGSNTKDIQIRGLPGQYTLILVDGKRQNLRETRTFGTAGYEQSFIPPISAIERIEIVRGPMSSLYGSDAMGGVINIITRKVGSKWTGTLSQDQTINQKSKYGDTTQTQFYLNGPLVSDLAGVQLWGRYMNRATDDSSVTGGREGSRQHDLNAKFSFILTPYQDLYLEAGTTKLKSDPQSSTFFPRKLEDEREHWSISHTGRWGQTISELTLSQETGKRSSFARPPFGVNNGFVKEDRAPKIKNTVFDAKGTTPWELLGDHILVYGGQYSESELTDQNPGIGGNPMDPMRKLHTQKFSVAQWALFTEDEWRWVPDFALTTGIRMNHHDFYDTQYTPRIYGVWNATDSWTIKGGVSTGFRAPDIRQIAPGYGGESGGLGCYYGPASQTPPGASPCGMIVASPNLKAEKSTSFEFGTSYVGEDVDFSAMNRHG